MDFVIAGVSASPASLVGWGVFIGLVFSLVGAAGGILASVGLISVFAVHDANLVKPMAQILTLLSPLISVPHYYKQGRVILSLVFILGAGGIVGAIIGSSLSATYLSELGDFKPIFAIATIAIAVQTLWRMRPRRNRPQTRADEASEIFQAMVAEGGDIHTIGVVHGRMGPRWIPFDFAGSQFGYAPWKPFLAGVLIAIISSALGVGGGFLLVPFMATVLELPMYIIAGTAALTIVVSSAASVLNYIHLGIQLDWPLLGFLIIGTGVGSYIGPKLSQSLPESGLRILLALVLLFIGMRYLGWY